jgi:hypothetical protein
VGYQRQEEEQGYERWRRETSARTSGGRTGGGAGARAGGSALLQAEAAEALQARGTAEADAARSIYAPGSRGSRHTPRGRGEFSRGRSRGESRGECAARVRGRAREKREGKCACARGECALRVVRMRMRALRGHHNALWCGGWMRPPSAVAEHRGQAGAGSALRPGCWPEAQNWRRVDCGERQHAAACDAARITTAT